MQNEIWDCSQKKIVQVVNISFAREEAIICFSLIMARIMAINTNIEDTKNII
jgi:hypothetical protein